METIQVRMILEVMGRPVENVSRAINELLKRLESEKGAKITQQTAHAPIKVKDTENLFTTFAEVEMEVNTLVDCFAIMFAYMPSNFEIVYPESIRMRGDEVNSMFGMLSSRLHMYDAIAKRAIAERDIIVKKVQAKGIDIKVEENMIGAEKKEAKPKKKSRKR